MSSAIFRYVRANSFCTSATWKPKALSTPGAAGITTGSAWISRPSALACSGPAPPKAIRPNSRGSKPRSMLTTRRAACMFSLAMSMIACAACVTSTPRPSAIVPTARLAASSSMSSVPASLVPGGMRCEHHVGVGHGGLVAAAAVGGRAGLRARALRAHAQGADRREVGDRAAAGADAVHVNSA